MLRLLLRIEELKPNGRFCLYLICPFLDNVRNKLILLLLSLLCLLVLLSLVQSILKIDLCLTRVMGEKKSWGHSITILRSLLWLHKTIKKPKEKQINIKIYNCGRKIENLSFEFNLEVMAPYTGNLTCNFYWEYSNRYINCRHDKDVKYVPHN